MNAIRTTIAFLAAASCFDGTPLQLTHVSAESDGTRTIRSADVGTYRGTKTLDVAVATEQVVDATNRFRTEHNLESVRSEGKLAKTATEFANYMASTDRYGHRADGQAPAARVEKNGYLYCTFAENIAYFFHSDGYRAEPLAKRSVDAWIASPGHRANMLKPHVTEIGVGVAQSETTGVYYAVQIFARPNSAMTTFQVENQTSNAITYSLGDNEYSVQPRYRQTHKQCIPQPLSFQSAAGEQTVSPADGTHYRFSNDGDRVTLTKVGDE